MSFRGVLLPGFVQESSYSCVVPIELFLYVFLASMWCIHTVVLTLPLLVRSSGLSSIGYRSYGNQSSTGFNSEFPFHKFVA